MARRSSKNRSRSSSSRSTSAASTGGSSGGSRSNGSRSRSSGSRRRATGQITNYSSAVRWLRNHTDFEKRRRVRYDSTNFSLNRMNRLLKALGNPHQQLRFVHLAGSKGKGSTVAMLEAMLRSCGYTVGTFTSPHLVDLRERIQINNRWVTHAELTDVCKRVKAQCAKLPKTNQPTFFEVLTAAALCHFADQAVDLAILETGLGGRLDSTNVVTPEACGITQISRDHTQILGEKLTEIAAEKAGILKPDVPAITVHQDPQVTQTLKDKAEQVGAPLRVLGQDIEFSHRFEANRELGPHTRVCLTTTGESYDHLPVPLEGEHQALNCGLAIALLDLLRSRGYSVNEQNLVDGLAETRLPGRMERAWSEPRILLDGAHNDASLRALIRSIGAHVPYDSLVMVFGCAEDKDVDAMLERVAMGADKVIFTRAKGNPRAMDPQQLWQSFSQISGKMAQTAETVGDALNLAARAVGREDLICVTGSFHLVGETKKYLSDLAAQRAKEEQQQPA